MLSTPLTFELEGELIGVVEGEHLLVGGLVVRIEDELRGEHEHRKASFHQVGLSVLLLLHWLQWLSSSWSWSPLCLGPLRLLLRSPLLRSLSANCLCLETPRPALVTSGTWHGAADGRESRRLHLFFPLLCNMLCPKQKMKQQSVMWFTSVLCDEIHCVTWENNSALSILASG